MKIVVDSREQAPFTFEKYEVDVLPGALLTGDYSLPGLESLVAIERKSLGDLVGCLMGSDRDRFERELSRAGGLEAFLVVIEASMDDVRRHNYRSRMRPHAVLQSVAAFMVRYRVPFAWCGSREGAEYMTFSFLEKYAVEQRKRLEALAACLV